LVIVVVAVGVVLMVSATVGTYLARGGPAADIAAWWQQQVASEPALVVSAPRLDGLERVVFAQCRLGDQVQAAEVVLTTGAEPLLAIATAEVRQAAGAWLGPLVTRLSALPYPWRASVDQLRVSAEHGWHADMSAVELSSGGGRIQGHGSGHINGLAVRVAVDGTSLRMQGADLATSDILTALATWGLGHLAPVAAVVPQRWASIALTVDDQGWQWVAEAADHDPAPLAALSVTAAGTVSLTWRDAQRPAWAMTWSDAGRRLQLTSGSWSLPILPAAVIDLTGSELALAPAGGWQMAVRGAVGGNQVQATVHADGQVSAWSLASAGATNQVHGVGRWDGEGLHLQTPALHLSQVPAAVLAPLPQLLRAYAPAQWQAVTLSLAADGANWRLHSATVDDPQLASLEADSAGRVHCQWHDPTLAPLQLAVAGDQIAVLAGVLPVPLVAGGLDCTGSRAQGQDDGWRCDLAGAVRGTLWWQDDGWRWQLAELPPLSTPLAPVLAGLVEGHYAPGRGLVSLSGGGGRMQVDLSDDGWRAAGSGLAADCLADWAGPVPLTGPVDQVRLAGHGANVERIDVTGSLTQVVLGRSQQVTAWSWHGGDDRAAGDLHYHGDGRLFWSESADQARSTTALAAWLPGVSGGLTTNWQRVGAQWRVRDWSLADLAWGPQAQPVLRADVSAGHIQAQADGGWSLRSSILAGSLVCVPGSEPLDLAGCRLDAVGRAQADDWQMSAASVSAVGDAWAVALRLAGSVVDGGRMQQRWPAAALQALPWLAELGAIGGRDLLIDRAWDAAGRRRWMRAWLIPMGSDLADVAGWWQVAEDDAVVVVDRGAEDE
jgi:hypothetical protein